MCYIVEYDERSMSKMKLFHYDKESVKKVLQIAWPAMLESFFIAFRVYKEQIAYFSS